MTTTPLPPRQVLRAPSGLPSSAQAAAAPPPPPRHEIGYAVDTATLSWGGGVGVPTRRVQSPELQWPMCIDTFEDMYESDAQVSSVIRAVMLPILRTTFRVDGTGCRPEVVDTIASDLGMPVVNRGNEIPQGPLAERFDWREHAVVALEDKYVQGHAFFEQKVALDLTGAVSAITGKPLYHLVKLGYRPPRSIATVKPDRDGGLLYIEQMQADGKALRLDVGRLVAYVNARKGGNWLGRSLLRPAYKNVMLKDRLLWLQTTTAERNGMGIPDYEGAPGETDLSAGEKLTRSMRAGDDAGIARPNGSKLQLLGVTGNLPSTGDPIAYHDEQIARSVLAHFLNLGARSGSGSYALGAAQSDFFTLGLQAGAHELASATERHVVRDLVTLNYGIGERAPRIVFDEIGTRADGVIQAVALLVQTGVLKPDPHLETYVRTVLGLPSLGALDDYAPEAA
jgi:hypothetical protein